MIRKTLCGLAALIGALILTMGLAAPTQAQEGPSASFVAADWPDPAGGPVEPDGSTVTAGTVTLVKIEGATGTDATTPDLGLTGDQLTVDYDLAELDQTAAGAVRFFAYSSPDADVSAAGQAPNAAAIADATSGTLVLDLEGGEIGTVGVTYDASNDTTGQVEFTDLELDGRPILFLKVADESPSPSPSPTGTAGPAPTEEPGASPSPTGTDQPGKGLPVTSGPTLLPALGIGGGVLLGLGGTLAWLGRRKRAAVVE